MRNAKPNAPCMMWGTVHITRTLNAKHDFRSTTLKAANDAFGALTVLRSRTIGGSGNTCELRPTSSPASDIPPTVAVSEQRIFLCVSRGWDWGQNCSLHHCQCPTPSLDNAKVLLELLTRTKRRTAPELAGNVEGTSACGLNWNL